MKQITIGRSKENDIVIDDQNVSRNHAVLFESASGIKIRDNGSSNGTFINGKRIDQESFLYKDDTLKLGTAIVPWMNYVDQKNIGKIESEVSPKKETVHQRISEAPSQKSSNKVVIPEAPKSIGVGAVKKIFGTLIILIGFVLIAGGIIILASEFEPVGAVIALFGLVVLIIGIVRVSTRSKSQVRREAELLTHNKFQAAIIASQNEENTLSDEVIQKLEKLNLLKKQGIISQEEFQSQKDRLLKL